MVIQGRSPTGEQAMPKLNNVSWLKMPNPGCSLSTWSRRSPLIDWACDTLVKSRRRDSSCRVRLSHQANEWRLGNKGMIFVRVSRQFLWSAGGKRIGIGSVSSRVAFINVRGMVGRQLIGRLSVTIPKTRILPARSGCFCIYFQREMRLISQRKTHTRRWPSRATCGKALEVRARERMSLGEDIHKNMLSRTSNGSESSAGAALSGCLKDICEV